MSLFLPLRYVVLVTVIKEFLLTSEAGSLSTYLNIQFLQYTKNSLSFTEMNQLMLWHVTEFHPYV